MTLLEIRSAMAAYLQKTVEDLTVNGVDLSLLALNQVRRNAEMLHDFEFERKQITVTVDGIDGGTFLDAVLEGEPVVEIKQVLECGMFDDNFNLQPVEWTTVAESIERQRQLKPGFGPRYPTDSWATTSDYAVGMQRIAICGDDIWVVPKYAQHKLFDLEFEVYAFQPDWSEQTDTIKVQGGDTYWPYGILNGRPLYLNTVGIGAPATMAIWYNPLGVWNRTLIGEISAAVIVGPYHSMVANTQLPAGTYTPHNGAVGNVFVERQPGAGTTDIWLKNGAQYLLWAGVVQVNHLCKEFVFRQEGNLPPPEKLAETALEHFRQWDSFKYEQDRRHVY